MLKTAPLKGTSKMAQFKDDSKYISSNEVDKFHDNFLTIFENEKTYNDFSVNLLLLKNNLKMKK